MESVFDDMNLPNFPIENPSYCCSLISYIFFNFRRILIARVSFAQVFFTKYFECL